MSVNTSSCFGPAIRWEDYNLPCPSISAFNYEIDAGLIRTQFGSGNTRQRRRYTHRPTYYNITWSGLTTGQLQALEEFTQSYGYTWMYMPLITGQVGSWDVVDHLIRFTSNPQVTLQQKDRWSVTVSAEQQEVNPECMFELRCDSIVECLEKAQLQPLNVDWGPFVNGWGNEYRWSNDNG